MLVKLIQVLTHAIGGLVKLGFGGFKIIIGDIVDFVSPQEFEIVNVAVINGFGQLEVK